MNVLHGVSMIEGRTMLPTDKAKVPTQFNFPKTFVTTPSFLSTILLYGYLINKNNLLKAKAYAEFL